MYTMVLCIYSRREQARKEGSAAQIITFNNNDDEASLGLEVLR